ncbi:MAG: hypothetical protein M1832_004360 [Thelocarpon impressellum]|nr:MAG: hypothetical protein M1832_004360 [Thelocarpon impressellum]
MSNLTQKASAVHPYYPVGIEVIGYLANEYSVPVLLATFAAGCAAIFAVALLGVQVVRPGLRGSEKATVLWFVLCGTIHLFFEGYFSLNHTRMGGRSDVFGQLWKEYSLSDSRYLTSESFVLCMETMTAFIFGPLSFVVAWFVVTGHPLRHPLQALVSIGQLYGDILYYATSMFDHYHKGVTYCRPEGYYFWCYYFFMNFIWIVIPTVLLYNSVNATTRAFKALDKMTRSLSGNGSVKKTI